MYTSHSLLCVCLIHVPPGLITLFFFLLFKDSPKDKQRHRQSDSLTERIPLFPSSSFAAAAVSPSPSAGCSSSPRRRICSQGRCGHTGKLEHAEQAPRSWPAVRPHKGRKMTHVIFWDEKVLLHRLWHFFGGYLGHLFLERTKKRQKAVASHLSLEFLGHRVYLLADLFQLVRW